MDKQIPIDETWLRNFHQLSVGMLQTLQNIERILKHIDKNIEKSIESQSGR